MSVVSDLIILKVCSHFPGFAILDMMISKTHKQVEEEAHSESRWVDEVT